MRCARRRPGSPRNGRAITRPDGVLAGMISRAAAQAAYSSLERHDVLVRGDLQHRVGRRVDDQVAGAPGAARRSRRSPRCRCRGGCRASPRPVASCSCSITSSREAVRVGAQRHRRDDAHQLPVAGDRVLARAERVQAAVEHGVAATGGDALQRQDVAEPERPSTGRSSPPAASATWPSVFAPASP